MLTNFVVDNDLKTFYPNISKFVFVGSATFTTQITEAFNILLEDLRKREIEVRKLGRPIDLRRAVDETDYENVLTPAVDAANATGSYVEGHDGYTRLVAVVTAGTGSLVLQGSNDQGVNSSNPPANWATVGTLTITGAGTFNTKFVNEYRYYRLNSTVTTALSYTVALYETRHDRAVVWKTYQLIFRDMVMDKGDIWYQRMVDAEKNYIGALSSLKLTQDSDDDNKLSGPDILIAGQIKLGR